MKLWANWHLSKVKEDNPEKEIKRNLTQKIGGETKQKLVVSQEVKEKGFEKKREPKTHRYFGYQMIKQLKIFGVCN